MCDYLSFRKALQLVSHKRQSPVSDRDHFSGLTARKFFIFFNLL